MYAMEMTPKILTKIQKLKIVFWFLNTLNFSEIFLLISLTYLIDLAISFI